MFYDPSDPISSNPYDLSELHMNTQTELNYFVSKQKPTTITAAPLTQNYVFHQTISPGFYTKNSPMLEPLAPNQASHHKANQATFIDPNINI